MTQVVVTVTVRDEQGRETSRQDVFDATFPSDPTPPTGHGIVVGTTSGNDPDSVAGGTQWNRNSDDYVVEALETAMSAEAGTPIVAGLWRRYYMDIQTTWPANNNSLGGRINRDVIAGRLPMISMKSGGVSWASVASGGLNSRINAQGDEMAAWQASQHNGGHKWNETAMLSFHHEPNNSTTQATGGDGGNATEYRDAYEAWIERLKTRGVTFAVMGQDGSVISPGFILCGPILSGGAFRNLPPANQLPAPGGVEGWNEVWWPASWTWGNQNLVASGTDAYNQGPNWQSFRGVVGGHPSKNGYKSWADKKTIAQNNAGRTHLHSMWEANTRERADGYSNYSTTTWAATGFSAANATKPNWLEDCRDWLAGTGNYAGQGPGWPNLFALTFFDSAGPNGNWTLDSTAASFQKYVEIVQDPIFELGG